MEDGPMRAPWLDGVAAGALLALSMAFVTPSPVSAQQPTMVEGVPVPEAANVPPPTAADFAPATPAAPATTATVSPAATPELAAPTATAAAPAATPAPAAPAPANEAAISNAVPTPESANVPPPTAQDVTTPSLSPADTALADKLREFVTTRIDRFIDGKKEQTAVAEFYKARNYAPAWAEQGVPSARMKAAIARLKLADADGLDANDYATPDLKVLTDADSIAQAELQLTNSLLTFARQAQIGRVNSSRISPNIDFTPHAPEPANILKTVSDGSDVTAALDGFNPPHAGFRALKAKLTELRGQPDDKVPHVGNGPTLKHGMKDKRVPVLRERLAVQLPAEADPADTSYDKTLAEAVKAFQKQKGMKATGTLTPATVDALNGRSRGRDVNTIVSNMERWRWLPRDLGEAYVMVNIPDFTLKAVRGGQTLFHTRIVTGTARTPSPSFSAAIETVQVNPSWHVPQSIIYGEYLPAMERDPGVLARMGFQVTHNRDGSIAIRQPPGERNALGRIKFNFPNKFQVYLHDTPTKYMFAHDKRAYSHGCMRVQNPDQFAEALLSVAMPEQHYTARRITSMYGGGEQWLRFKKNIPVHLVYMNAYVDDAGKLVIRDDVYGWDGRVQSALRGQYLVVAERSQKVGGGGGASAGRAQRARRQVVEQQPRQGFFLFPFFR
jgi:murein L,D-transpeptidase YcbB/YkuD